MIDKLTSYAYDDITQKLDEVIDAVNGMISPQETVSPRADNETGHQFHKRTKREKPDLRESQRRVSVADRRSTRDGDYYIGRRWGPHERRKIDRRGAKIRPDVETTAWKLKTPEPLRDRIAGVLCLAGLTSYETPRDNLRDTWNEYRLKLADAIIKELGL